MLNRVCRFEMYVIEEVCRRIKWSFIQDIYCSAGYRGGNKIIRVNIRLYSYYHPFHPGNEGNGISWVKDKLSIG